MSSSAPTPAAAGLRRFVRVALATMALGGASAALAADGVALMASGQTEVVRGGNPLPLAAGGELVSGDLVRTGADGRLQIRFSDGAIVSLQPRSEFRIDQYQFDAGTQRGFFSLVRGALRTASGAIGKRNRDDYRMQTPTATVGIRGTEYSLEETVCDPACYPGPRPGTRVAVSAGRIAFGNTAGTIEVAAGQAAAVDGAASPPRLSSERPLLSPRAMTSPSKSAAAGAGDTTLGGSTVGAGTPAATATSTTIDESLAADNPRPVAAGESPVKSNRDPATSASASTSTSTSTEAPATSASNIESTAVSATDSGAIAIADPASIGGGNTPRSSGITAMRKPAADERTGSDRETESSSAAVDGSAIEALPAAEIVTAATWPQWVRSAGSDTATAPVRRTGTSGSIKSGAETTVDPSSPSGAGPITAIDASKVTSDAPSMSGSGFASGPMGAAGNPLLPAASLAPTVPTTISLTDRFTDPVALIDTPSKSGGSPGDGDTPSNGPLAADGSSGSDSSGGGSSGSGSSGSGSSGSGSSGSGSSGSGSSGSGSSGSGSSGSGGSGTTLVSGLNQTSGLQVRVQEIPLLADMSFVASSSTLHLDDNLRLDAIGNCSGLACLSRGTTRFGSDTGHDAYASWGRWTDGDAHLRSFGVTWMRLPLSENQGVHYLIGTPTVSMPTSGTFSYGIVGATQPTISDGSTAPGTFVAAAVVQFASGLGTKVGLQGTVAMATGTMTFATTGGTTNPQASNLQMTSANTFNGQLATQSGGASPLSCGQAGCRTTVTGGFFGPQAARLGFGYSISGDTGQRTIGGVGVLSR